MKSYIEKLGGLFTGPTTASRYFMRPDLSHGLTHAGVAEDVPLIQDPATLEGDELPVPDQSSFIPQEAPTADPYVQVPSRPLLSLGRVQCT